MERGTVSWYWLAFICANLLTYPETCREIRNVTVQTKKRSLLFLEVSFHLWQSLYSVTHFSQSSVLQTDVLWKVTRSGTTIKSRYFLGTSWMNRIYFDTQQHSFQQLLPVVVFFLTLPQPDFQWVGSTRKLDNSIPFGCIGHSTLCDWIVGSDVKSGEREKGEGTGIGGERMPVKTKVHSCIPDSGIELWLVNLTANTPAFLIVTRNVICGKSFNL